MPSMEELLETLDSIELPDGQYAIFGSGPMAVRGLREPGDLDVIVSSLLWLQLLSMFPSEVLDDGGGKISVGAVDLFDSWGPGDWSIEGLIANAELIDGHRYVRLEEVLAWKIERSKPKDLPDIKILEQYLLDHPGNSG